MAHTTFDKTITIAASPIRAYDELSQPERYLGLQPLLTDVRDIQPGRDAQNRATIHYHAVERIAFLGIIPYNNNIRVEMIFVQPGAEIKSVVKAAFGVQVHFTFSFVPEGTGLRINEHAEFDAPAALLGYVTQQAHEAQDALLANLKARLETPESRTAAAD